MRRFLPGLLASAAALLLAMFAALFAVAGRQTARPMRPTAPAQVLSQDSVGRVVRRTSPAVVRITVLKPSGLLSPQGLPLMLESQGSGFLVDPRGGVLTSAQLVAGARRIEVRCSGLASPLSVVRVKLDGLRDVALLQVHPPRLLPALKLGPASGPLVGSYVVALGGESAALGIISADTQRIALAGRPKQRLLQTDAPIDAGKVGGPLLDLGGRVVGMAQIGVRGAQGIAFAIPAQDLRLAMGRLEVSRPMGG